MIQILQKNDLVYVEGRLCAALRHTTLHQKAIAHRPNMYDPAIANAVMDMLDTCTMSDTASKISAEKIFGGKQYSLSSSADPQTLDCTKEQLQTLSTCCSGSAGAWVLTAQGGCSLIWAQFSI